MANDFEYNRTQEAGRCLRIEELRSFLTLNALHRVTVLVFIRHLAITLRNSTLLYTLMPTAHETITEENIDTMYNGFFFLSSKVCTNESIVRTTNVSAVLEGWNLTRTQPRGRMRIYCRCLAFSTEQNEINTQSKRRRNNLQTSLLLFVQNDRSWQSIAQYLGNSVFITVAFIRSWAPTTMSNTNEPVSWKQYVNISLSDHN